MPKTFREAVEGPDKKYWIPSSKKEFSHFILQKSWRKTLRRWVESNGYKVLKTKWVFKLKDEEDPDLKHESRIVVKGYQEILTTHYTETFAPTVSAATVNIIIAVSLYRDWETLTIDIEAAFLNSEKGPNIRVFIEWPKGMEFHGLLSEIERQATVAELVRPMYGKCNLPHWWYKTIKKHLAYAGAIPSSIDPCLFYKKVKGYIVLLVGLSVDDLLVTGVHEHVEILKKELKKSFNITAKGGLDKYLGLSYKLKKSPNGEPYYESWMKHMRVDIVESFEKETGKEVKLADLPGFPGQVLHKNTGETIKITPYRSIVGKILYMCKKTWPDTLNAVRDLTTHFANPGEEHWKALGGCVGYIKKNNFNDLLILRKPVELRAVGGADMSFAPCKDDRKSIQSDIISLGGCFISGTSKKVPVVCVSTSEGESCAVSESGADMKFIYSLLDKCVLHDHEERMTGWLYNDNLGTLHLSKHTHLSPRTKHMEIRAFEIKEYQEQGIVEVLYEKSANLLPDVANKNLPVGQFRQHASNLRLGRMIAWREDVGKRGQTHLGFVQVNTSTPTNKRSKEDVTVNTVMCKGGSYGRLEDDQTTSRTMNIDATVLHTVPCSSTWTTVRAKGQKPVEKSSKYSEGRDKVLESGAAKIDEI